MSDIQPGTDPEAPAVEAPVDAPPPPETPEADTAATVEEAPPAEVAQPESTEAEVATDQSVPTPPAERPFDQAISSDERDRLIAEGFAHMNGGEFVIDNPAALPS